MIELQSNLDYLATTGYAIWPDLAGVMLKQSNFRRVLHTWHVTMYLLIATCIYNKILYKMDIEWNKT